MHATVWVCSVCFHPSSSDGPQPLRVATKHFRPILKISGDASRIYRQMVVLVSFVDCDFSIEDPLATYHASVQ